MGESVRCACEGCDTYLEVDDCLDSECDGFVSTYKYVGHCPNCGTNYSWVEIYTWQGIEDFKEETNNG